MTGVIAPLAHSRLRLGALAIAVAVIAALLPASASAGLPKGFEAQQTITGLTGATGVAYAPDGRAFVIEKEGVLKVAAPGGGTATTLLDISSHVNSYGDRGLLGVAVDKDFATNGYVYLLYTYESDPLNPDFWKEQTSRLSRIKIGADGKVVTPDPETVLLGTVVGKGCPPLSNTVDCIPSDGTSHSIGSVRVDPKDGTLFVGTGDAADFGMVDKLALRTYDEFSYVGKILHIDRDGNGLAGHSFCPTDTNLTHVCTKIYAKGFRNPFRFQLRPEGGLTVGDVGWNTWEEIDLVDGPGGNYGWPCYEAHTHTPGYEDLPECAPQYANEKGPNAAIPPDYDYDRSTGGSAVMGGPTYVGDQYPAGYENSIFLGDYTGNFVKRLILKANGDVDHVETFATDWIGTALELSPEGNLVAVNFGTGAPGDGYVEEYVYTPGNASPTVSATADQTSGPAPLTVKFTGGATDPDGDPLTYAWTFGDGGTSTAKSPTHVYTQPGTYTAKLMVDDGRGKTASKSIQITPGGDPPSVRIDAPTAGSLYRDGGVVQLKGSATDKQDGVLTGGSLTWVVRLIHSTHFHPLSTLTGTSTSFDAATDHDADSHYEIKLIAKDKAGMTAEQTIEIFPETVPLTIQSTPAGAPVSYGGRSFFAPTTQTTAIGYDTTITAAERFSVGARRFQFDSWSDGGWLVHDMTVPDAASTLTASYIEDYASGGVASASSVEFPGTEASNALDDSELTRWSSAVEEHPWWQVDLGSAKPITRVDVDWEAAYAARYRILTSLDGVSFSEAAVETATGAGTRATTFAARSARYVRIETVDRANTGWGVSAFDVRALGPIDSPVEPPVETPRDVPPPIIPPIDAKPPPGYVPPPVDTTRPVLSRAKVVKDKRGKRALTLRVSERGTVTARLRRKAKGRWHSVKLLTKRVAAAGQVRIALPNGLKAGSYSLVVTATDRASNAVKKPVTVTFRVG